MDVVSPHEKRILQVAPIAKTLALLQKRVVERFPRASLVKLCATVRNLTEETNENINWIERPMWGLRFLLIGLIALGVMAIAYAFTSVETQGANLTLIDLIGVVEASINDIIFTGAALFFCLGLERRLKREKTIECLNQLRMIAHVIDMHQLTKDPHRLLRTTREPTELTLREGLSKDEAPHDTSSSPKQQMSAFELQRYLDYCAELFALLGKVAAFYAQSLPDPVVVQAATEIELLCSGLSRKVWQKLMILNQIKQELKYEKECCGHT